MSLRSQLAQELLNLVGNQGGSAVSLSDPGGLQLHVHFVAVDSMSCSFSELQLHVPALQQAAFDVLRNWADDLSKRITYLLEQIGPLEYDPSAGQVLIRSVRPDTLPDGSQYYEIVLSSQSGGDFSLRRYRSTKGQSGRAPVDITVTHEVLLKLVDDLVATAPQTP
ncbi:MAG: hypothetical protein WD176_00630 [Pirellulales bacterium]